MGSSCYGRAHEKYKVKLKDRGLTRISTTSIHLQNTAMLSDIQNVGDLSEMLSVRKKP